MHSWLKISIGLCAEPDNNVVQAYIPAMKPVLQCTLGPETESFDIPKGEFEFTFFNSVLNQCFNHFMSRFVSGRYMVQC